MAITTLPITEVRAKLPQLVKAAGERLDRTIITSNGKPSAVIMSYEEYESWEETLEILSDADALQAIQAADEELAAGQVFSFEQVFGYKRGLSLPFAVRFSFTLVGMIGDLLKDISQRDIRHIEGAAQVFPLRFACDGSFRFPSQKKQVNTFFIHQRARVGQVAFVSVDDRHHSQDQRVVGNFP